MPTIITATIVIIFHIRSNILNRCCWKNILFTKETLW